MIFAKAVVQHLGNGPTKRENKQHEQPDKWRTPGTYGQSITLAGCLRDDFTCKQVENISPVFAKDRQLHTNTAGNGIEAVALLDHQKCLADLMHACGTDKILCISQKHIFC